MSLSQTQRREINESLEQFGLSHPEQEAYIALLQHGTTTASPIAQALHVPLTTAQSILQRLAKRGVVHVSKRKSRSIYEAKDPAIFKILSEQHVQDLTNIIPLLRSVRSEQPSSAQIRVYARERISDIFRMALLSKNKLIHEIVSAHDLQEVLGERFHFSRRRVAQQIQLKSLRVESHEIKKYNQPIHQKELREAKFLPRELSFRCSVLFWDDMAAFFTPPAEGLAWVVRSPATVEMLQQTFDLLWSVSRKMETA